MGLLGALTYHLKVMPYRNFLPKTGGKGLGDGSFSTRGKESSRMCIRRSREILFMPEESLMNDEYN